MGYWEAFADFAVFHRVGQTFGMPWRKSVVEADFVS